MIRGKDKKDRFAKILDIGAGMSRVLFPPRCPLCTDIVYHRKTHVCRTCRKRIPYIHGSYCMKCGKQLEEDEQEYCTDCRKKTHEFERGVALWAYHEDVKNSVYRFKYSNQREYAESFAEEIVMQYGRLIHSWKPDALIPVPMYHKKQKKRGFNQAQVLAEAIGTRLDTPVVSTLLVRTRDTRPQKELNDKERIKNIKNAFHIVPNGVKLEKVILVDDIYTTGSTVDEAARQLLGYGIRQVYVISLCIGKGY